MADEGNGNASRVSTVKDMTAAPAKTRPVSDVASNIDEAAEEGKGYEDIRICMCMSSSIICWL